MRVLLFPVMLTLAGAAAAQQAPEGRRVFTQGATPPCAICHALADAQASGEIGPDLDRMKPDAARVRAAVESGPGNMPAYESLSPADIEAVSSYVAEVAGRG
jgi:mono/diheme cytochrome c family protein